MMANFWAFIASSYVYVKKCQKSILGSEKNYAMHLTMLEIGKKNPSFAAVVTDQ